MLGPRRIYFGRISLLKFPHRDAELAVANLDWTYSSHQIPFRQMAVTHHTAFSSLGSSPFESAALQHRERSLSLNLVGLRRSSRFFAHVLTAQSGFILDEAKIC